MRKGSWNQKWGNQGSSIIGEASPWHLKHLETREGLSNFGPSRDAPLFHGQNWFCLELFWHHIGTKCKAKAKFLPIMSSVAMSSLSTALGCPLSQPSLEGHGRRACHDSCDLWVWHPDIATGLGSSKIRRFRNDAGRNRSLTFGIWVSSIGSTKSEGRDTKEACLLCTSGHSHAHLAKVTPWLRVLTLIHKFRSEVNRIGLSRCHMLSSTRYH